MTTISPLNHEVSNVRVTVSHSEVESYLRCERQHFYGYGVEIQRDTESDSLNRGTLGHAALEAFFNVWLNNGPIKPGDLMDQAQAAALAVVNAQLVKQPIVAAEVFECLSWFFSANQFEGWEVLGVEQVFQMVVKEDGQRLVMPFVIDLIARDRYGDLWVIDHKFMYDFISDRDAELMPQLPKYVAGMRVLGHHIDKAGYSVLRYRSLKEPTVDSKYRFVPVPITETRLRSTIIEQVKASERIQELKRQDLPTWSDFALRTANKMVCNSCSFRSLCVAELNDWQPNLILNSEYKKKERREFKEIEQGS